MNCIIVFRINGGPAQVVTEASGEIHEFPHMDAAVHYATESGNAFARLVESGQAVYQIVELDEI